MPVTARGRLAPILTLALSLRIALPVGAFIATRDVGVFHAGDTGGYVALAESLARAGRFGDAPEIVRTPGYPLFLVPGVLLGRLEAVTIALQIAFSVLTVSMVWRLAVAVSGRRDVAWVAALLYALEPLSIIYASKLLTETLFTAIVTAALLALAISVRAPTPAGASLVGVGLAAAACVRPVAYFLPLVVGAALVGVTVAGRRRRSIRPALGHVLLLVVVAMGLTGLWRVRNWTEAGYPGFAAIADVNMYFYLGASVQAAQAQVSYEAMRRELAHRFTRDAEQNAWTPAQQFAYMASEGRRTVLGAPLTYGRIHADGIARLLIAPGATDLLDLFKLDAALKGYLGVFVDQGLIGGILSLYRTMPAVFWSNVALAPLLLASLGLAVLGIGSRALRGDAVALVMLGVAAYLVVVSGGPTAYARFRHPVMPVVCVYAACGLAAVSRRFSRAWFATPSPAGPALPRRSVLWTR